VTVLRGDFGLHGDFGVRLGLDLVSLEIARGSRQRTHNRRKSDGGSNDSGEDQARQTHFQL
jgi:hypothetical protein